MRTIDNEVYQMITRKGFIALFWAELAESRRNDPTVTYEQVFQKLNERYLQEFGEPRYRSYEAFRKDRDKHR
ncbi:hypothetical protein [Paratractidigestivibacter sp.]|uniref:hypothetical protein n=1 Tax=Paratractidigestivibacter sp. TaxID=2847316 RepID=UPI002AC8C0B9|nr:hypothetical protein [Paratractidigestivibacter sp.]